MTALNKLKAWIIEKLGESKKVESDTLTHVEAGEGEREVEHEVESIGEEYAQEQIMLKFRAKPGEDAIDVTHEFTHIPTEEEVREEFGPGLYNIFLQEEEGKRPKLKKRYRIDGHPILPVDTYEVKVRVSEGGELFDTKVEFPGPAPPTRDEIINSIGGGGFVKLNAKNKEKRVIWFEWYDFTDVEPPESLKRRDSSFKSRLEKELDARKRGIEEDALKQISGGGEKAGNKFDATVNKLIDTLEDKKLEKLEEAIERFGEKIGNPGIGGKDDSGKGLTDIAFKEPYLMKLQAQKDIIATLAKTDPEAAIRALEKMPDGVTVGLKLALAGTGLVEAFTDYMKEQSHTMKRGERGKQRGSEKEMHGKKEAEKEKEEVAEAEKMKEQLERESAIGMHEQKSEEGFEIKFDIGEGV